MKLPATAATCHAIFSYGPHIYICARSSDKSDHRGRSRGDVMWRLEEDGMEWTRITQMPHVQWHYGSALDGTRVIFAGGWDGKKEVGHVIVFDLNLNKWLDPLTAMPTAGFAAQAFVTNEYLYLVGPTTRQADLGEVFLMCLNPHSPSYNKWRTLKMPETACGSCIVNRHIVIAGGWDNSQKHASSYVHLFDADCAEWLMLPSIHVRFMLALLVHE